MHIHVGVENLHQSIQFYSALFGAEPAKVRDDYAKWMLDDPRINFAVSTRAKTGLDHLGLQVDEDAELAALRERLESADLSVVNEGETVCCYARSDKSWV
ncbi:MAG: VOC family protein, partial [Pseudohongiellaceae bacterium]